MSETKRVADVGDVDPHAIGDRRNVVNVSTILRHEAVDQRDTSAGFNESNRQRGADEAKATGDGDAFARERGQIRRAHRNVS